MNTPPPQHVCPGSGDRSLSATLIAFILGISGAWLAAFSAGLEAKYIIATIAAAIIIAVSVSVADSSKAVYFLVALFALSIPFYFDIHFFAREHIGGAVGLFISVSFLLIVPIGFLLAYKKSAGGKRPLDGNRPMLIAPVLYMAAGICSLVNASYPVLTLFELFRIATLIIIFLFIMNLHTKRQISTLIAVLIAGAVIESVLCIIQYKTGRTLGLEAIGEAAVVQQFLGKMYTRTTGTLGHPNIAAYYFEMLLPLSFAMLIVERSRLLKALYFAALVIGAFALMTTLSRGAWITLPLSLSIVFFVLSGRRLLQPKTGVLIFLGGLLAIVIALAMYPTVKKRLFHDDYRSAEQRIPLNQAALSVIRQYPVFGVGLNNGGKVFKQFDATGKSRIWKHSGHVVHNMFLAVCMDVGVVGLLAFLGIFVVSLRAAFKILFRVSLWYRGVLIGVSAGIIGHLVHSMFDPGFLTAMNISTLVFTLLGIIGSVSVMYRSGTDVHQRALQAQ